MGSIIIIAAVADNNVIGNKGELPWKIPEDMKLFKSLTYGNVVIMGRKTFESLGKKPLQGRTNIVVSNSLEKDFDYKVCDSLNEAIKIGQEQNKDIFIIGGASIYKQALPLADMMCISHVKGNFVGDTFFPDFNIDEWKIREEKRFDDFTFKVYVKKNV